MIHSHLDEVLFSFLFFDEQYARVTSVASYYFLINAIVLSHQSWSKHAKPLGKPEDAIHGYIRADCLLPTLIA